MDGEEFGKSIFEFYTLEGATALRDKLQEWQGGRLVVHITEMPIKCPVAPLEFSFLADSYFKELTATTLDPLPVKVGSNATLAAEAVVEPVPPAVSGIVSPLVPACRSLICFIRVRIASFIPLGAQPSAISMPLISVLLAAVALYSLIFVIGISLFSS
jgi:hypothetical protein